MTEDNPLDIDPIFDTARELKEDLLGGTNTPKGDLEYGLGVSYDEDTPVVRILGIEHRYAPEELRTGDKIIYNYDRIDSSKFEESRPERLDYTTRHDFENGWVGRIWEETVRDL